MDQEEKNKYTRAMIGFGIFLPGLISIFLYMLYSNYRHEHYGKFTGGLIIDKSEIRGSSNAGYWIRYRTDSTAQEIFLQSQERYSAGDSVGIYYLADDPRSIKFADDPHNDLGLIVIGCMIFVFGFIFIMTLCFPETMIGYFRTFGG